MRTFLCLLLFTACLARTRGLDLLDPTSVVDELSQHSDGLEKWKKPDFCGKMDCPPFKTKKHTDNYDVRQYDAGKWLVTNVTGTKFELAYTQGAAKLLKYFKSGNDKGETIDVTTPTLAELKVNEDGETSRDYAFSLWIPEKYQKDTPQPTDADVKVVNFESITVYVRVFGGFATEGTIMREARSLQDILKEEDQDYGADVVWAAIYDPPQKLLRRHNEVHIPYAAKKS